MRILLLSLLLFAPLLEMQGQTKFPWGPEVNIMLEDFKGEVPPMVEDSVQQSYFASRLEYNIQYSPLFNSRNINRYVHLHFTPEECWIEEGENTEYLVAFANLNWDMAELYARKFRQKAFNTQFLFADPNTVSRLYDETLKEMSTREVQFESQLRVADDPIALLAAELEKVNREIEELSDFCKMCKPKRKRR